MQGVSRPLSTYAPLSNAIRLPVIFSAPKWSGSHIHGSFCDLQCQVGFWTFQEHVAAPCGTWKKQKEGSEQQSSFV